MGLRGALSWWSTRFRCRLNGASKVVFSRETTESNPRCVHRRDVSRDVTPLDTSIAVIVRVWYRGSDGYTPTSACIESIRSEAMLATVWDAVGSRARGDIVSGAVCFPSIEQQKSRAPQLEDVPLRDSQKHSDRRSIICLSLYWLNRSRVSCVVCRIPHVRNSV